MGRLLLILPPSTSDLSNYQKLPWGISRIPPVGLFNIASYVKSNGHEVKVLDCRSLTTKYEDYPSALLQEVKDFHADIVGVNVLTANFKTAFAITGMIKEVYPTIPIVAGGVHPSVEPELTFQQNPYIDMICVGEGEEVCLELLDGVALDSIQGLVQRGKEDQYQKREPETSIDKYPFPDFQLGDSEFYTEFTTATSLGWGFKGLGAMTSRSCPFSCKFCASDWSKPYRKHSPEYIVGLVKHLSQYPIDVVVFYDDAIASDTSRFESMCRMFIENKLFYPNTNLRWFTALRANQTGTDRLKMMKEAGCFGISIGMESGSERTLQTISKNTSVEVNRVSCVTTKKVGLALSASFMIDIPEETREDMNKTITLLRNKAIFSKGVGSFRPLPGSPFYDILTQSGVLDKQSVDWENLGNFTVVPDRLFGCVPRDRFDKIYDRAQVVAHRGKYTAIHADYVRRYPELIAQVASKTRIKVASPDNYSLHRVYRLLSMPNVLSVLRSVIQVILPMKIRRAVRTRA